MKCKQCGKEKERDDRVLCNACLAKDVIRKRKHRQQLKEKNLCLNCGKPLSKNSKSTRLCDECLAKKRLRDFLYVKKRKENRICIRCGKPSSKGSINLCDECLEKERVRQRLILKKRKENGLCIKCGRPLIDVGGINTNNFKCINCAEYKPEWN